MANATLSIGEVAEKAGVNVSAIRFYEREGLPPEPELAAATQCECETLPAASVHDALATIIDRELARS
jgi:hypothetical protein